VAAVRLSAIVADRADGPGRLTDLLRLLEDHASAGSELAQRLLALDDLASAVWVVEPVAPPAAAVPVVDREISTVSISAPAASTIAASRQVADASQPLV
jgi:hypothetical protein